MDFLCLPFCFGCISICCCVDVFFFFLQCSVVAAPWDVSLKQHLQKRLQPIGNVWLEKHNVKFNLLRTLNLLTLSLFFCFVYFTPSLTRKHGVDEARWRRWGNRSRKTGRNKRTCSVAFLSGDKLQKGCPLCVKKGLSSGRLLNNEITCGWLAEEGGGLVKVRSWAINH